MSPPQNAPPETLPPDPATAPLQPSPSDAGTLHSLRDPNEETHDFTSERERAPDVTTDFSSAKELEQTLDSAPRPGGGQIRRPPAVAGYEITGELGRGGMGVVYKARHLQLKRTVALKMILAGGHAGSQEVLRFQAEAEAIARLEHPNIVRIYEISEQDGHPFFALEFAGGGSLAEKLRGTPLPTTEAARLTAALASAMEAAHQGGIVHRDLKPANILFASEGVPKITDFGLAKFTEGESDYTHSGAVMGTPSYMAPEQARGGAKDAGPAADIYALGAVLYEMLTGRPPFRADSPFETIRQVIAVEPVRPTQLQPRIPRDLETICLKCLDKEPRRRYASAQALADDLESFLAGKPISARPSSASERAIKWARRHPAVATLSTAILIVTLIGLALVLWQWRDAVVARREEARQKQVAVKALGQVEATAYVSNVALAQRECLAQRFGHAERLLDECPSYLRNWEWHLLKRLCANDPPALEVPGQNILDIELSAGGRWLATLSSEGTARLFDLDASSQQQVLHAAGSTIGTIAMSSDERLLAAGGRDGKITIWQLASEDDPRVWNAHDDGVTSIQFSPDGRLLASGSKEIVKLWRVETGEMVHKFTGHYFDVTGLAFTPDGETLASAGPDKTIRLWNPETGEPRGLLRGHNRYVSRICISPDGKQLASAGGNYFESGQGELKLWDLSSGKFLRDLPGHSASVRDVVFCADGERLVSCSWDQTVKVWEAETGKELLSLPHEQRVEALAVDEHGRMVASADANNRVRIWNGLPEPERAAIPAKMLGGHMAAVNAVAYSSNGRLLASASNDHTVMLWDPQTGKLVRRLEGHVAWATSVAFSPDDRYLASGSIVGIIKVWEVDSGKEVLSILDDFGPILAVVYSPDGSQLLATSPALPIKAWNTSTGALVRTFDGHTGVVMRLAMSPKGRQLASASDDRSVRIWDLDTGREVRAYRGHKERVNGLSFSADGNWLVSSSLDDEVHVWRAGDGQPLLGFRGQGHAVAFHPDGLHVAAASGDGVIRFWNLLTGRRALTLEGHTEDVFDLRLSARGSHLASASDDGTVRLWDLASLPGSQQKPDLISTGQELLRLRQTGDALWSLDLSPDQEFALSGDGDAERKVRLWRVGTGEQTRELSGHEGRIEGVAFSPDGLHALSGSADKTVRHWDLTEGKLLQTYTGHADVVTSVAYVNEKQFISASLDHSVRLWQLENAAPHQILKGHTAGVIDVAVSRKIGRAASVSWDTTARVWDLQTGEEVLRLQHPHGLWAVAYSSDGKHIVTGEGYGEIRIWDAKTGQQLRVSSGHRGMVVSLAFTAEGRHVLSSGQDGTVRLWELSTGKELQRYDVHNSECRGIALQKNGQTFLSVGFDGTLRHWSTGLQ